MNWSLIVLGFGLCLAGIICQLFRVMEVLDWVHTEIFRCRTNLERIENQWPVHANAQILEHDDDGDF